MVFDLAFAGKTQAQDAFLEQVDVFPTLLELMGVQPSLTMSEHSFYLQLMGQKVDHLFGDEANKWGTFCSGSIKASSLSMGNTSEWSSDDQSKKKAIFEQAAQQALRDMERWRV